MMDDNTLRALEAILGSDGVEEHATAEVDGVPIGVTLRPQDVSVLSDAIAALGERGLAAVIRGSGSRLGVGNPPRRPDVFLSTEHLRGIDTFEPDEGVCEVRAGTPVSELRAQVNAEGWEVPLDPLSLAATVGGTLAAATVGPRVQAFGPPRDAVLGLEVALAIGTRTRCGGRVVKNVTGYDMNKLYTGSFGTLGVIASAWLRLKPLPRRVRCFEMRSEENAASCSAALTASRVTSARTAALLASSNSAETFRIVVELAGDDKAVEQDAARLEAELGAEETAPQVIDAVRDAQSDLEGAGGLRFRISALASHQPDLVAALRKAGAAILCYPGLRLVYAGFPLPPDSPSTAILAVFDAVANAAMRGEGSVLCESAPAVAKAGRDMHGDVAEWISLFGALKRRFDPNGVLNPGRFAGGI